MKTKIAIVALTLLASSPSVAQEPPPMMVACESIELYDRLGGDFQKAIKAGITKEQCPLIFDSPPP